MDRESGRVLGSKNMDQEMLIASTTKVMTSIVAIENTPVTDILCASDEVLSVYGSMIYINPGECMTLYDLLVGLNLRSGNDAAMVIATQTLGYDNFIRKMNETAIRIGMNNTVFENPHGLDDDSKNYSTAYDMALLMRYATNNKVFMEITKLQKYVLESSVEKYIWYNKNKLLSIYKYATGGKIGYTGNSGHIFVSSASKARESLVIATFKDKDRFNTHKELYEKYFKLYDSYKVVDKYTFFLSQDYYKDSHLYVKNDINVMLSKSEVKDVDVKVKIIKKKKYSDGDTVGTVSVYVKDEFIKSEPIYITSYKSKSSKFKSLFNIFK